MNAPGQPTAYRTDYRELAHNYCLLGATNQELAQFFGVSRRTVDNWIADIPEFAAAVREGRAFADARVARCLYDRATGYSYTVQRIVLHRGEERTIANVVHHPPDTQACIFWLRNRRRQSWRDKVEVAADGVDLMALLDEAGERARVRGRPRTRVTSRRVTAG